MTITSLLNAVQYVPDGTTVNFGYSPVFFAPADLLVTLLVGSTITNCVLNGTGEYGYTVNGAQDVATGEYLSGATITFLTAPVGTVLTIQRRLAATQTVSLNDNSKFPAKSVEGELDRLTMLAQQLQASINLSMTAPLGDVAADLVLPPAPGRANTFLAFDSLGNAIASAGPAALPLPPYARCIGTDGNGKPLSLSSALYENPNGLALDNSYVALFTTTPVTFNTEWGYLSYAANGGGGYVLKRFYFPVKYLTTVLFMQIDVEALWDTTKGTCGFFVNATDYQSYVDIYIVNSYGTSQVVVKVKSVGY
jgi:hypothetical protein